MAKDITPQDPQAQARHDDEESEQRGLFSRIRRRVQQRFASWSDRQLKDAETPVSWS